MVVVSLFTKEIPRDELGGLTWPTINDPPLSHGAIGENVERGNDEKTDNGKMQMKGKNGKRMLILSEVHKHYLWTSIRAMILFVFWTEV